MLRAAALFLSSTCRHAQGKEFLQTWDLVEQLLPHTTPGFVASLPELEATLTPMYNSLPKDEEGLLGYDSVRYALHRMLVDRHGWYVKGLEPDGKAWNVSSLETSMMDWVPPSIQHVVGHHFSKGGLSLRELAAVAALLEDSARDEARRRLETVYKLLKLEPAERLMGDNIQAVLDAWMYLYLDVHEAQDYPEDEHMLKLMMDNYEQQLSESWRLVRDWMGEMRQNISQGAEMSFNSTLQVTIAVGEKYAFYDAKECQKLKRTLLKIESDRPGRVLLSSFYRQGMAPDANFRFVEKIEYLRDIGALDESDPRNPAVIVPNYVTSKPQCLESSEFYSVCCRSECEDLLQHVEESIVDSHASVADVLRLVEALPSPTVQAPRDLPPKLIERLQQVAEANGGRIPLHGRLFAQWMHHAFPRECPFPHEAGTTAPLAAQDWTRETGHSTTEASEEDMVCYVDGPCAGGAAYEAPAEHINQVGLGELPWTDKEELFAGSEGATRTGKKASSPLRGVVQTSLALVVFGLAVKSLWQDDGRETKQASSIFSLFPNAHAAAHAQEKAVLL
eukprot:TRINITY_DN4250_c0_g1_i1.p1 TRINITY_DN4250_c0_g1~~TRINITY_DN4250_c0_g1_i1.p1  ORF type:complete len:562 (+),score=133.71 TRINITY_DN4250_c0_g1_i1:94-1779(+)